MGNKDQSGGFDPVTEADRAAERAIRDRLADRRPHDGIVGEEFGAMPGSTGLDWIIDPIDGTRAFVAGLATWGTIIGAGTKDRMLAGMFCQAFLQERFWGADGESYYSGPRNGSRSPIRLRTSATRRIDDAILMTTSPRLFSTAAAKRYDSVEADVRLARYGADGYAYCLLAAGQIDLVIEDDLKPYDIAGLVPIIEGAGGIVTDWSGESVPVQGGQVLAAANPALHEAAVAILSR